MEHLLQLALEVRGGRNVDVGRDPEGRVERLVGWLEGRGYARIWRVLDAEQGAHGENGEDREELGSWVVRDAEVGARAFAVEFAVSCFGGKRPWRFVALLCQRRDALARDNGRVAMWIMGMGQIT